LSLTLEIEDARWRKLRGISARLKKAVTAALAAAAADPDGDLTLLLATDRKLRALNRDFRGRDVPTNVLSFPSDAEGYLGDIAIAYGVAAGEAKAAGRTLADHATHLAVHGVLHLIGFDHGTPRQAEAMEVLEARILKTFDIANPYETR